MKNLFLILAFFCALNANAQNYLINFNGSGASTTVSTVIVENLANGTSLTLNGSDILHLTGLTGISQVNYEKSSGMKIYPNPMIGNSTMEIFPPVAGDAIITVFDMTGKLVTQIKRYLENSLQEFRLSGINTGFYLISVKGTNYQYSGKLLCNAKSSGTISIEKISNNQVIVEKTSKMDYKGAQTIVDMAYTTGDRIKFTGISGNYSTIRTDIPIQDKTLTFNFILCKDGDNNNYATVQIGTGKSGTQVWMADNLKTTKYKDGTTSIHNVTTDAEWKVLTTPAYCWYKYNEATYKATYGALYNYYTVSTGNLCPTGWHVPRDDEWTTLITSLGGDAVAGGKLKETGTTHWVTPNTGATNEVGFTALPGGNMADFSFFDYVGFFGMWWSATQFDASIAWSRILDKNTTQASRIGNDKKNGFSVRCVMD